MVDQKIVSCLAIVPEDLWMDGRRLPMGGIAAVSTLPAYRRRGYAGSLLVYTIGALRDMKRSLSVLFPADFSYYRKFGWELVANALDFSALASDLSPYGLERLEKLDAPYDYQPLDKTYTSYSKEIPCRLARSKFRWQEIVLPQLQSVVVHRDDNGHVDGYLLLKLSNGPEQKPETRVLEGISNSVSASRALIGYLATQAQARVSWWASPIDLERFRLTWPVGPWHKAYEPRSSVHVKPWFMARITDVSLAMVQRLQGNEIVAARLDGMTPQQITLAVHDSVIVRETRCTLVWNGQNLDVIVGGSESIDFRTDQEGFVQLYCGYLSASDAVALGLANCYAPSSLQFLDRVFRTLPPSISEADEF